MKKTNPKILLLGSNVKISNLAVREVSLLEEGSLPAYGYNPGDDIELLAGPVTLEKGRLGQCQTWLSSQIASYDDLSPQLRTLSYGDQKDIYQIFRQYKSDGRQVNNNRWFMVHQLLPSKGRGAQDNPLIITEDNLETLSNNKGMLLVDDSGVPPQVCDDILDLNTGLWCIAMGISVAHWKKWAEGLGDRFTLICRLSDLETTRMEMDASVNWETIVAMCLRSLRTSEVGLWDKEKARFHCHIIVEMFPHGILYVGPETSYFRYNKGCLPEKSSPRRRGSVPCYDTLVPSMLAVDSIRFDGFQFCRNYIFDFTKRVLLNWNILYEHGYSFAQGLEFPNIDFSPTYPEGSPCSFLDVPQDPVFIDLPPFSTDFDNTLDLVSGQEWSDKKKQALRVFFRQARTTGPSTSSSRDFGYLDIIVSVLMNLKEEVNRGSGFDRLAVYQLGHLRTTDPAEIDPVITLHNIMESYVSKKTVARPLCIGVFGPPGSGKSFAVRQVANEISKHFEGNPFDFFEFNLTQFANADEINAAIDPIRAAVAQGKVPIAFWDEFDCRYKTDEFGYLRYFLPAMQDGVTYVHGIPYHIGRSIFVFAGGVKSSWEQMEALLKKDNPKEIQEIKTLKIPDFMSRLRVVLDIDGIEIPEDLLRDAISDDDLEELRRILLKRAFIIAHQMQTHWKSAARKTSGLLLRLLLGRYNYGARSIEAVIEASRASDRLVYGLPELIAPSAARIHAQWRIELERRIDHLRKTRGLRAVW